MRTSIIAFRHPLRHSWHYLLNTAGSADGCRLRLSDMIANKEVSEDNRPQVVRLPRRLGVNRYSWMSEPRIQPRRLSDGTRNWNVK